MTFFAPRRVAVCGSSVRLQPEAASFCEAVGEQLGSHPNIIILNRGIRFGSRSAAANDFAADFRFIAGAMRQIGVQDRARRIETYINDRGSPNLLFMEGRILQAEGRSGEARRFYMVSKADAVIAVSGGPGTLQQLVLANALDLPILPIPTFPGTAREFWHSHRDDICARLRLSPTDAARFETMPASASLAIALTNTLLEALERRCFVIMPFAQDADMTTLYDRAIAPAVLGLGDRPIRLDRESLPGNVGQQIEQGIAICDYAIAVLDRARPNVFYELGLAHAQHKPVIILRSKKEVLPIPFDISMHQRIDYDVGDEQLSARIRDAIASFSRLHLNVEYVAGAEPRK